jgi:hypothetical protein
VRSLPEWRSKYLHLVLRQGRKIAKVAMARRLAVHLFWIYRQPWTRDSLSANQWIIVSLFPSVCLCFFNFGARKHTSKRSDNGIVAHMHAAGK